MTPFKEYIAKQLVGKTLEFKCDCIARLHEKGRIISYEIQGSEIIFLVEIPGRNPIHISENHPNMTVSEC